VSSGHRAWGNAIPIPVVTVPESVPLRILVKKQLVLVLSALSLMSATCDSYNKIVKSTDRDYKLEKAKEYYNKGNYYKALPLLEELLIAFRGDSAIETVYYYYCYAHYGQGTYLMASQYFKHFYNSFPHSPYAEEMLWMNGQSLMELSPVPDLDQTYTEKAIDAFQLFVNIYPQSPRLTQANHAIDSLWEKLETKEFNAAMSYYHREEYKAAAQCFANLSEHYSASDQGEHIQLMRIRSLNQLALNSTERRKLGRYQDVLNACREFEKEYASSASVDEVVEIRSKSEQFINHRIMP
jgi:outer membrane protein assembly factor BamD